MKMFTFEIAGNLMGLEARYVHRVLEEVSVSPVCFMPTGYQGLLYYRGELFDVVDLPALLKGTGSEISEKYRFIVARWSNHKMVLAVHKITGLLWSESQGVKGTCYTTDGLSIQIVTPEQIWEKLRNQPYGPV